MVDRPTGDAGECGNRYVDEASGQDSDASSVDEVSARETDAGSVDEDSARETDAGSVDEGSARDPDSGSVDDSPEATEEGPALCAYCGRKFATQPLRSLHQGRVHTDELTEVEWAAVVDARETETDRLRKLRIRLLIGLTICYFGLLVLYATV